MNPLRLGVIGMGQRTVHHGWDGELRQAFEEAPGLFEVAAICDNRPDRLAHAAGFLKDHVGVSPQSFPDYTQMLAEAGLDAVYIASPNHLHREMAVRCFEAGCDVLCEKPMATSLADADAMIAAARRHGRILALAMQMHYRKRYHRVAELIREGRIGEPVMAWCMEFRGPYAEIKDWVWETAKSGGALVEKNCHHADILDLFTDGRPLRVFATGGQKKYAEIYRRKSEIVDHAWINWECDNGVKGMIGISFVQGERHEREFGVIGTEGKLKFDLTDGEKIHLTPNRGEKELIECPGELRGGMSVDFCHCVRTRETPLVTPERGRASLLVPLAAERSIAERRVVQVAEVR